VKLSPTLFLDHLCSHLHRKLNFCLLSGVANMTALGNVVNWQKVEYDFKYHKQDFPSNILVLIVSEGKSIVKVSSFSS
jgi:hypothetical protein